MIDDVTDWTELREFKSVDLTASFVLSWTTKSESLLIDLDLSLCPDHAFYEKPRPAEKACFRPAILEFPHCEGLDTKGKVTAADSLSDTVAMLGHGAIEGLRRIGNGIYEITGAFGRVEINSERPVLRLKGPFA